MTLALAMECIKSIKILLCPEIFVDGHCSIFVKSSLLPTNISFFPGKKNPYSITHAHIRGIYVSFFLASFF
jgi:hypothetical protein